jgi:PPOX class probable F420-dependent enzyme
VARTAARNLTVDRDGLVEFIRPRHDSILHTSRADGRPQLSPLTVGVDGAGRFVASSYPERAKVHNLRARPAASIMVLSDQFGGEWVQVDGTAEILDLPGALDGLVEYFRVISGEHSDWDEYRAAMTEQGKCLIRVTIEAWGPVSRGGFPARLVGSEAD